jgi:multisubunit Na+/H+ antiporter MnhG subunit
LRCQLFVGLVLLSLGGLVYFLFIFDTSVATGTGDRVHNIGKMNNQRNFMILSILCLIGGAIGLYMQGKAAKDKGLDIWDKQAMSEYRKK